RRRHTRFSRDWSSDVCSSDLTPGENQKGHAFAVRRAGRAVQCLVMALHIRRQTEGRSDGFLLVEPLVFELLVIDIEQWMADRARSEERRVGKGVRAGGGRGSR